MTVETIKDKLRAIETDVAAVRKALDELEPPTANAANGKHPAVQNSAVAEPTMGIADFDWPPHIRWTDKKLLGEAFREAMRLDGIPEMEPIGALELQRLMREDGIKAEDNILSSGIIEMREE